MDMHVKPKELTYAWLYKQVQAWNQQSIYPKRSTVETWSFRIGLLAAVTGLLAVALPAWLLQEQQAAIVALICLLIEVTGFLTGGILVLKREWRQYAKPRLSHAEEMDGEFNYWRALVDRLRQFPRQQREERLSYVQFRNWKWGDWASAFDFNLLSGVLVFTMVLLYVLGWVLIAMRTRLDTYVNLLQTALKDDDGAASS